MALLDGRIAIVNIWDRKAYTRTSAQVALEQLQRSQLIPLAATIPAIWSQLAIETTRMQP